MKEYKVIFRDGRKPKRVLATHFLPQGEAYVFYNPSGYGFEIIPVYLVEKIVEVKVLRVEVVE